MNIRTYKKSRLDYSFLIVLVSAILTVFIGLAGCENTDTDESKNGTLNVKFRTWNTYVENTENALIKDSYNFDLTDVRTNKYEMKFTTDEIQAGKADSDINWVTVYTSDEMMLDSERDFYFELPPGDYKGFGLLQGRDFFWVISDGSKTIEIPDSNGGGDTLVYNVFGLNGLYERDSNGVLQEITNNEKIGTSFTIVADTEHSLTVRMNLDKLVWFDNDESGGWSNGDSFEGPTLPHGIETMADFIFGSGSN